MVKRLLLAACGVNYVIGSLPGEKIKLLKDGRVLVAHPDHLPKVVNLDGSVETLTRDNHPDLWAQFEAVINQLLRPN